MTSPLSLGERSSPPPPPNLAVLPVLKFGYNPCLPYHDSSSPTVPLCFGKGGGMGSGNLCGDTSSVGPLVSQVPPRTSLGLAVRLVSPRKEAPCPCLLRGLSGSPVYSHRMSWALRLPVCVLASLPLFPEAWPSSGPARSCLDLCVASQCPFMLSCF